MEGAGWEEGGGSPREGGKGGEDWRTITSIFRQKNYTIT